MNPEIKAQWLTALRSGEFRQARQLLRTPEGYCCLGVLCELAARAGAIPEVEEFVPGDDDMYYGYGLGYRYGTQDDDSETSLPGKVMEWAGLDVEMSYDDNTWYGPEVRIRAIGTTLSALNDEGNDFNVIADVIEEYL
jgi:hypothetical protein